MLEADWRKRSERPRSCFLTSFSTLTGRSQGEDGAEGAEVVLILPMELAHAAEHAKGEDEMREDWEEEEDALLEARSEESDTTKNGLLNSGGSKCCLP